MKDREYPCITPNCSRLLPAHLSFCRQCWCHLSAEEKRRYQAMAGDFQTVTNDNLVKKSIDKRNVPATFGVSQ